MPIVAALDEHRIIFRHKSSQFFSQSRVDVLNDMPGADANAESEWMQVSLIWCAKAQALEPS
jgi:hypothetical protein